MFPYGTYLLAMSRNAAYHKEQYMMNMDKRLEINHDIKHYIKGSQGSNLNKIEKSTRRCLIPNIKALGLFIADRKIV